MEFTIIVKDAPILEKWETKVILQFQARKNQTYYNRQIMKRNKLFDELVARIQKETMERVEKQMTCKWFRGGDCGKGLPGTPCILKGCVAWEEYKEDDNHE